MKKVLPALLFASFSQLSWADSVNYDFIEFQWQQLDVPTSSYQDSYAGVAMPGEQFDGFGVSYSRRLPENWLFRANYWSADSEGMYESSLFKADSRQVGLGIGYVFDLTDVQSIDISADIGRFRYQVRDGGEVRSNTFGGQLNFRWQLTDRLELNTGAQYVDYRVDWLTDETSAHVGLDYRFSNRLSVGGRYRQYNDADASEVYVRYRF